MTKAKRTRAHDTLEFKQVAVWLVDGGQSIATTARMLGLSDQTQFNRVRAHRQGKLKGVEKQAVSAKQLEISRPRAELARVKMARCGAARLFACWRSATSSPVTRLSAWRSNSLRARPAAHQFSSMMCSQASSTCAARRSSSSSISAMDSAGSAMVWLRFGCNNGFYDAVRKARSRLSSTRFA